MMFSKVACWVAVILVVPFAAQGATPPKAFGACAACHSDQPDALGPDLHGVVGRKAGSVAGYHYSGPMRRCGLTWDAATLAHYLENPQGVVPGNRMPMDGVPADQAEAIVSYLQQIN
jgi:cytochrome c